jgi:hypothetical protein
VEAKGQERRTHLDVPIITIELGPGVADKPVVNTCTAAADWAVIAIWAWHLLAMALQLGWTTLSLTAQQFHCTCPPLHLSVANLHNLTIWCGAIAKQHDSMVQVSTVSATVHLVVHTLRVGTEGLKLWISKGGNQGPVNALTVQEVHAYQGVHAHTVNVQGRNG